jgi:biopolymer transport protein ExbD
MGVTVGQADSEADQEVMSAINTTPLVDVMLVLLIIFLITIPAIIQQVPVELPQGAQPAHADEAGEHRDRVNKDGDVFWNQEYMKDSKALFEKLKKVAVVQPQPEIPHPRRERALQSVGRVVATCQRAAILKLGFITRAAAAHLSVNANSDKDRFMAMNVGSGGAEADPDVMVDINTTPLIDVMLVLSSC